MTRLAAFKFEGICTYTARLHWFLPNYPFMTRHRLSPEQIVLDEPLQWDVYDESGQLLLCEGYRITRESQRDILLARNACVDDYYLVSTQPVGKSRRDYNPLRLWASVLDELEALLRNIRLERAFASQILGLAQLIHKLASRSADTALAAMIFTDHRRYGIVHSVHVAILCDLVAERLGWAEPRRQSLVCAALTMNLTIIDLQNTLSTQRSKPMPEQRAAINRHPQLAVDMLEAAGVSDETWLRSVREHHEVKSGAGYPYGIATPSEESMVIQTADIFSAKVSPRAARKAMSAPEAAKSLYLESESGSRNPYIAVLIKEIGIYPPGTFVRLANGETALVVRRGSTANAPEVLSLKSADGMPYGTPQPRATSRKPFDVVAVIPRDQINIQVNIEKIWHSG